jgi:hypothetical protein
LEFKLEFKTEKLQMEIKTEKRKVREYKKRRNQRVDHNPGTGPTAHPGQPDTVSFLASKGGDGLVFVFLTWMTPYG